MKTTNTINILALLLSLLFFVGCEKEVNDERLRVTPSNIEIGCEGGTVQVDIESTSGWEVIVERDCTWVKSDRYESEVGRRQWIKLTISKNNTENTRNTTITIRNSGQSRDITITQTPISLNVSPESIDASQEKTTKDISINSNISWSAKSSDSWITISKSSGDVGYSKTTITIAKNTTANSRTGHVEIYNKDYNVSKKVAVTQKVASLTINPGSIDVGAESITKKITIESNIEWSVNSHANWITLSKSSGTAGTTTLNVNIEANTLASSRTGQITVYNQDYNITKKIVVNQAASTISVSTNSIEVGPESSTQNVNITSNIPWTAKTSDSWITISKNSGYAGTTTLAVNIGANTSTSSRSGYVEIVNSDYNMSKRITINQDAPPYIETAEGINLKMIFVHGGTFAMGSAGGSSEEEPVHAVTLVSYYIAETEITQAQWRAIMGTNPSWYEGDNRPVEYVLWEDAQEFCEKLSELTGKRYVLPTEAQWEYAARGGNKSNGYTYSGSNNVDDVAVHMGNKINQHSNVKSKKPNELGLYDMSGNVYEWCSDWYDSSYYSSSPQTNPQGPSSGSHRVARGGSWEDIASYCRVAYRYHRNPSIRCNFCGFRVVCIP